VEERVAGADRWSVDLPNPLGLFPLPLDKIGMTFPAGVDARLAAAKYFDVLVYGF
jgi:hypothetical protein